MFLFLCYIPSRLALQGENSTMTISERYSEQSLRRTQWHPESPHCPPLQPAAPLTSTALRHPFSTLLQYWLLSLNPTCSSGFTTTTPVFLNTITRPFSARPSSSSVGHPASKTKPIKGRLSLSILHPDSHPPHSLRRGTLLFDDTSAHQVSYPCFSQTSHPRLINDTFGCSHAVLPAHLDRTLKCNFF